MQLAERIAQSDRQALKEFHEARPVFRLKGGPPLLLIQFLDHLRDLSWALGLAGGEQALLDEAYDLTVDKFVHVPPDKNSFSSGRRGPDCRPVFAAFAEAMADLVQASDQAESIQQEMLAARVLQERVIRAFRRSCLDARRSCNPSRSRYAWQVDGHVLYVWLPRSLEAGRRRQWLEENVPDVSPARSGERYRVQAIVDDRLGIASHLSIDEEGFSVASRNRFDSPADRLISQEITCNGLAEAVGREKADALDEQRPAIRALGGAKLGALIQRIFRDLSDGCYEEKQLASEFGLSRPTLSRFAGSRWELRSAKAIPDLWANTAATLANHAPFADAAKEAGVWDRVQEATGMGRSSDD